MAMEHKIGSPEASDYDSNLDSISITSTILSEQKDEYPLEAILAEDKFNGVTKYLVKWEGYDENRCTWETRSMFQDGEDSTFFQWETQKMRVKRGLAKPFDVPAFKKRVDAWLDGIAQRRTRRRAKRQRMGLPVSPIEDESQEDSSDSQAEEEEEEEPKALQRRSSLKRRADSMSKNSDGSQDSETIDTEGSQKTVSRLQWTSREEGALMHGLRVCKSPDWARILSLHHQTFKGFDARDLEAGARQIKSSFRESGRDVPQELRAVAEKPSSSNKRIKNKVHQRNSASREHSIDQRDRGSETEDSLVEELRVKQEAKETRKTRKPDATKKSKDAEEEKNTVSRERSRSGSANRRLPDAQTAKDRPGGQESRVSPTEVPRSGTMPRMKQKPSTLEQGKHKTTNTASRLKVSQAPTTSRPGSMAATAPMMGAPRSGPYKPPVRPQSQMGAMGRGPMRATTSSVFLPKKPKRHATGAAVLSNWDAGKKLHGNSSLAPKSLEAPEGPEKVYNKHSIRRRMAKKGRTEPAPNMENLQLIDPKDGKAVKRTSIAVPASTSNKSAFEMIREGREQAEKENNEDGMLFGVEPDDTALMGAVEEDLAAESRDESRNAALTAAMSSRMANPRQEAKPPTILDVNPTKKPKLTLQKYYSKRSQPDVAYNSVSATFNAEYPPNRTPTSDFSALKLTSPTARSVPSALQPASLKSPELPIGSDQALRQASSFLSGDASPPDQPSPPTVASFSDPRPTPRGCAPLPTHRQASNLDQFVKASPTMEGASVAPIAEMALGQTSRAKPPSAPKAVTVPDHFPMQGPPFTNDAVSAPRPNDVIWSYEKDQVYGNLLVGPQRSPVGPVRFRGFDKESRKRLLANKTAPKENLFWLRSLCTAADYESQFNTGSSNALFWPGQIVPYSFNLAGINEISEILRLNVSGALFSGKDFTLLVYPPDSQDWAFLDEKFPEVPPVGLRCIMRTSIQLPAMESCDDKLEKIRKGLVERGKKITFTSDEPVINAVMRNVYNIDYQRLIRQPKQDKTQEANKFFLIFPKERRAEHDLIVQFLDANDAAEVYSYDEDNNDGTWEYFYRHVKDGVIIAHSTFWRFHHIPNLAKLMWNNTNVWSLALRKAERISKSHLVRLFPHGCMLLLTDSLLLLQPLEAVKILTWYRLRVFNEKPNSTWKIITRPNIRRFLLNCCQERKLDEEGRRFVQIYEQIAYMLDPEDLYDWEADEPKEEAPIYCMQKIKSFNSKVGRKVEFNKDLDHAAIAQNDDVLAEFFAGWANVHMESYRRFHIISGSSDEEGKAQRERWAEKWSYVEVFTPLGFYKRNSIPEQAVLDREAVVKHKATMSMLRYREQEIEESIKADEAEYKAQMVLMEKEWKGQLDKNLKLKETYEGLMRSGGVEEMELLGKELMREKKEDDDTDWSDDGGSIISVEMGEVVGNGDEDMVDVGNEESSGVESWDLDDGDESSGSDSD